MALKLKITAGEAAALQAAMGRAFPALRAYQGAAVGFAARHGERVTGNEKGGIVCLVIIN